MQHTKEITVDLSGETYFNYITATQGDEHSRFVKITIISGGLAVPIPKGATAVLRCKKPDGTFVLNDAVVEEGSTITAELTENMLAAVGNCRCEVTIYNDGSSLTTVPFIVKVTPGAVNPQIESTDEYQTLEKALSKVQEAVNVVNAASEAAERANAAAEQVETLLKAVDYELLNDITLEEDVNEVMRDRDDQGSPFKLRKFLLIFIGKITSGSDLRLRMRANGGVIFMTDQVMQFPADGKAHVFWVAAEKYADGVFLSRYPNKFIDLNDVDDMLVVQGAYQETTACKSNLCLYYPPKIVEQKDITKWHFNASDKETDKLLAGSRILVWGVRE